VNPSTIAAVIKAAAATLTDEKSRKRLGCLLAVILSPFLLIVVVTVCIFGGGTGHNNAAVQYANGDGALPPAAPDEYRSYMKSLRNCFDDLDHAIEETEKGLDQGSLRARRVKAIFYALHFGASVSDFDEEYYGGFTECFAQEEQRERVTKSGKTKTYTVKVPVEDMAQVYENLEIFLGRSISDSERSNAEQIYNAMQ